MSDYITDFMARVVPATWMPGYFWFFGSSGKARMLHHFALIDPDGE